MNELMQRTFNNDNPRIVNASESHMACLFLVDTSGSMQGEPINELVSALNRFKTEVCEDNVTRKVLDVAIVQFDSEVNIVQEFVPVEYMDEVSLEAYGGTDMNSGLRAAIDMVVERSRFYCHTGTQPYCPWIVMITDGYPNDSIDEVAEEILALDNQDKLRLWSLAVKGADTKLLNKLGHGKRVLELDGYDFTGFFDWVNKSMRSISVSSPGEKPKGQELPDTISKVIDDDWM